MNEIKQDVAKFKYTGKTVVLICNKCGAIIKDKRNFTKEENDAYINSLDYPPQYCNNCKENDNSKD